MKKRILANILACLAALSTCTALAGDKPSVIRMATTTSTYETGLLDVILPPFEKRNDIKVHVLSVGTGKAMKIAENGDVDLILVHARKAEDRFINDGFGVNRRDVMYNDFILLGPNHDPANVQGISDIKEALKTIRIKRETFVSRGDDSGTDKKEQALWAGAGITPSGSWYLETGQGMSATLVLADEKDAYVLTDRATYLARKDKLRLTLIAEGGMELRNPYGVIAVNPKKHSHVKYPLAMKLIEWLTAPECQKLIGKYTKSGRKLFHPNAARTAE